MQGKQTGFPRIMSPHLSVDPQLPQDFSHDHPGRHDLVQACVSYSILKWISQTTRLRLNGY